MSICKCCKTIYDKTMGRGRPTTKDFGYCSVKCIILDKPPCPGCGKTLEFNPKERPEHAIKRIYCSQMCGIVHVNSAPKSEETKKKMTQSLLKRDRQVIDKITQSKKRFWQSAEGQKRKQEMTEKYRKWQEDNPEATTEMRRKQKEAFNSPEGKQKRSEWNKRWHETEQGKEHVKKVNEPRKGVPRNPQEKENISKAVQDALEKFWKSPEGQERLRKTAERNAKYGGYKHENFVLRGPGWEKVARQIRERDNYTCQICRGTPKRLPVHHIYNKKLFNYLHGINSNHLYSQHQDNLITLCDSCHSSVEQGTKSIPEKFQEKADMNWNRFVQETQSL